MLETQGLVGKGLERGALNCHCCYQEILGNADWQEGLRVVLDTSDPVTVELRDAAAFLSASPAAGCGGSARQPAGPPPPHLRIQQ